MRKVIVAVLAVVIFLGANSEQMILLAQSGASEPYSERPGSGTAKKVSVGELVDINRASTEELAKLPGMTRIWAERVVKFRPYKRKTDLLEHGVLPDRVYDRVKDFVVAHQMDK
jgi:DNA uptake protein ComE-like DNA-binding protein